MPRLYVADLAVMPPPAQRLIAWICALQDEVKNNMYTEQPSNDGGLAVMYTFKASDISTATNGKVWLLFLPPEARRVG